MTSMRGDVGNTYSTTPYSSLYRLGVERIALLYGSYPFARCCALA